MSADEHFSERAFLFGPVFQKSPVKNDACLDELSHLVEAAGGTEVGRLVQLIKKVSPATYFGSGKIAELCEHVEACEADVAVFDEELSPAQARNIEKALCIRVLDRSELILDIFASRARTHQAKLQVSLAQLKYKLPRLKRMWTHLDRIHSAIGARGPGETQIETDRRLIRKKIQEYTKKLDELTHIQHRTISNRTDFKVSLVGYTNAGKSSLMQALTGEKTHIADQLFVTLDTLTRKLKLDGGGTCLLSDTVGFVDKLPHHLVSSFHATLSEAMEADLLLHVVDSSDPLVSERVRVVEDVLGQIGCSDLPILLVANKIDRETSATGLVELKSHFPDLIPISAKTGEGIPRLLESISRDMSDAWLEIKLLLPFSQGKLLSTLKNSSRIIEESSTESGIHLHLEIAKPLARRLSLVDYQVDCTDE